MKLLETGTTGGFPRILEMACEHGRRPSPTAVRRALKLLLASRAFRVRLELSGPWPGDGTGWLSSVEAAAAEAIKAGKEFGAVVRSGETLTPVAARRLAALGGRVFLDARLADFEAASIRRRLARLERLGVPAALEIRLSPEDAATMPGRLAALEAIAPAQIRLRPSPGGSPDRHAGDAAVAALSAWLESLLRRGGDRPPILGVLNFWEEEEPELLSSRLTLSADGDVGWATAARHADIWPEFKTSEPSAPLARTRDFDRLIRQASSRQQWAKRTLAGGARESWTASVSFAVRLNTFFRSPFRGFRDRSENKILVGGLLRATLADQDRFLRLRLPAMESVFYFVRSGCLNDCIFCKRKIEDPGQSLDEAEAFLKENRTVKRRKIALVGNEPLLHPKFADIVRLCRRFGFKEIEVMTSGTLLADPTFAGALQMAGVTAVPIPLYSADPAEHDVITGRKGSFDEAARGIENLKKIGVKVYVHTNLMRQNLRSIRRLQDRVASEWGLPFSVLCLRPKDPDSMNLPYGQIDPSYRELLSAELKIDRLVGFPVCISRRIQGESALGAGEMADGIKIYMLHQNFVKPESCSDCPETSRCLGTFREHLELYPEDAALLAP